MASIPLKSHRLYCLAGSLSSALVIGACHESSCRNDVISGAPSPDGTHIAFIFHRRCGARAPSTEVTIIGFHASLRDEPGNVLRTTNLQPVKVTWRSPIAVVISGVGSPSYERDGPLDGIRIELK